MCLRWSKREMNCRPTNAPKKLNAIMTKYDKICEIACDILFIFTWKLLKPKQSQRKQHISADFLSLPLPTCIIEYSVFKYYPNLTIFTAINYFSPFARFLTGIPFRWIRFFYEVKGTRVPNCGCNIDFCKTTIYSI